ncbi:(2Fe-2S)-binding protein [Roseisalinus antarcticus]|uniref:Nicotinate dehydrogenase subunit A n=1 Tax=Roseisalinus antarcticus TaxID=254357 RepID=A0A1Y5TJE8_9RHOB|nr:2Fe-2S iron-sulfur cluster-binding protein [Roseisalinus antarcticus]SLN65385.1 Nicotinate dehydrogenase subunit A [Roseisalinus antarcticus]
MGSAHLTVNGTVVALTAEADTPLLYVLRDHLGLQATRVGCGEETCGACTVIVNGTARFSCTLPLSEVEGAAVETAEGLVSDGAPHPLAAAFQAHQAAQCGYCLPGILMRAKAHLDAGGAADRASLAAAIDPNLCRCGTHLRILAALQDAARTMQAGD